MKFENKKLKALADRIINIAVKTGYKRDEIEDCYIEKLLKQTTSLRIKDFMELAYYKGIFKGFQYCDTLINVISKQKSNGANNEELEKENEELIKRLEMLNEMVLKIENPPQSTGTVISDGRAFVSYRKKYSNKINEAIKAASDNKEFLEKIK